MKTRKIGLGACLALAAVLLPSLAFAGGPSFFEPVEGDLAVRMLTAIFGEMIKSGATSPLASTLMVLNSALLTVAGVVVFYTMVFSVASSAKDGSFMGRKLSSLWVPIRTTLGIGLLVPMGSGINTAQLLVGWLAVQGVGLADKTWTQFASTVFTDRPAMTFSRVPQIESLASGMMRSLVCYEGLKEINSSGASAGAEAVVGSPKAAGGYGAKENKTWGTTELPTLCGAVSGPVFNSGAFSGVGSDMKARIMGDSEQRAALIVQAHSTATAQMEADLQPIAARLVQGEVAATDRALYLKAISRYEQTVSSVAREQLGSAAYWDSIKEASMKDGYLSAGSFYLKMAAINGYLQAAYGSAGKSSAVEKAPSEALDSSLRRHLAALQSAIGGSGRSETGIENAYKIDAEQKNTESSFLLSAINKAADEISDSLVAFAREDISTQNPMFLASNIGAGLLAAGSAGVVGGALLGIASAPASFFIIGIAGVLLASGVALAYLVPLVPLLIFLGAAVSFVLNVALGTIGICFFALAKTLPSSDEGLAGASKPGYGMMLSLFFLPSLNVLGFAFACVIFNPVASFITDVLFSTIRLNSGGGLSGLVGTVFGIILYVIILLLTLRFVFRLVSDIPQMALSWAGIAVSSISGAQLTQEASKAASAVSAGLGGAAAAGSVSAARGVSKSLGPRGSGGGNSNLALAKTPKNGEGAASEGENGEAGGELGDEGGATSSLSAPSRFSSGAATSGGAKSLSSASAGEKQEKSEGKDDAGDGKIARTIAKATEAVSNHVVAAAVGGGVHQSGFVPSERTLNASNSNKSKSKPADRAAAGKAGTAEAGAAGSATQAQAAEAEAADAEAETSEAEARAQAASMPEMNGKA